MSKKVIRRNTINWEVFSQKALTLIEFASEATVSPIDSTRWEEIIVHVLKSMNHTYKGKEPKWNPGSHAPGADIWVDAAAISAKSGSLGKDSLKLSSYRLTRFVGIKQMISYIDGEGKNFDVYLCCARKKENQNSQKRTYKIYVIPANCFKASKAVWKSSSQGWGASTKDNIVVTIRKKMSNQLWLSIPLKLCQEIGSIEIEKSKLGSKLSKVLR